MFGTLLTVAFTLLLGYTVWRAATVPWLTRLLPRRGIVGLGIAVWAFFLFVRVFTRFFRSNAAEVLGATLEPIGMALLGTVFVISTWLLLVDLATGFGWFLPTRAPRLRGVGLAAGLLLSGFALFQGLRAPAVVSYEVTLAGLPPALDGRVLVAVADVHLGGGRGEAWFDERVGEIQALHPDLVVFLGDIFEGHGGAPRSLPALGKLAPPLGKWFVGGNHESHGPGWGAKVLLDAGFRSLEGGWAEPAPGLVLAGVGAPDGHRRSDPTEDPIGRALANRPVGTTVLLSHIPRDTERAAKAGVQLMLSGHTHGGQLWPFGYVVQRLFPLLAGRYDVGGMAVVVSRGVGSWGPRMRLWQRGELVRVTLRAPRP